MQRLLLELIRRDAFYMEVDAYDQPWSPNFEIFSQSIEAFRDELVKTLTHDCFCAFALEIPETPQMENPDTRKLISYRFDRGAPRYVPFSDSAKLREDYKDKEFDDTESSPLNAVEWLWNEVTGSGCSRLNSSVNDWKNRHSDNLLIYAPYFVKTCDDVEKRVDEDKSVHQIYESLSIDDRVADFLYTKTINIDEDTQFPKQEDWYVAAAWVIGIADHSRSPLEVALATIEAATISFQMSWGYPQLIADRESRAAEAVKRAEAEVREKLAQRRLEAREHAIEIMRDMMKDVSNAYFRSVQIMNILVPLASQLDTKYRSPLRYFVDLDEKSNDFRIYHQKWKFLHRWESDKIRSNPEAFRSQFACILLFFKGDGFPEIANDDVWPTHLPPPWAHLNSILPTTIELFLFMFGETFQKILTPVDEDFAKLVWTDKDATAFDILRGCFHHPFKENKSSNDYSLTGPLLLLWATEFNGTKSVCAETYENLTHPKHITGDNWVGFDFLTGLHGIFYPFRDDCTIQVNAARENYTLSVHIDIVVGSAQSIAYINDMVGPIKNLIAKNSLEANKAEFSQSGTRSFMGYILRHTRNKSDINCDIENGIMNVSFEVEE